MLQLKGKTKSQEVFERYLRHYEVDYDRSFAPRKKGPPDYRIETPFGKIIAAVVDYDHPSDIQEKLKIGKKRWNPYKRKKVPFTLVLYKGGLPGLEHRFIQDAIQNDLYPEISAVGLLEGKAGQERLRIFHNRFSKYRLDRRIFDHERDKNIFLADRFKKHFFWIVEEAL
jgi:hypothetical protein